MKTSYVLKQKAPCWLGEEKKGKKKIFQASSSQIFLGEMELKARVKNRCVSNPREEPVDLPQLKLLSHPGAVIIYMLVVDKPFLLSRLFFSWHWEVSHIDIWQLKLYCKATLNQDHRRWMVSMATPKQILEQFLPTLVHCSMTLITCWLEHYSWPLELTRCDEK